MATLGAIRGQIRLDVRQAIAAYAAVRAANAATLYALRGGSLAFLAVGRNLGAVGLLLGAGLAVAVKSAADFEKQLDYVSAVSDATAAEMDQLREKALQLGQDTRYSAGEIADSFVELGKAGVSAQDIVGGVAEAVTNLGAAADIPLDRAAQIIVAATQTWGLAASEATRVADLLAGAANASIVEIEDLGVSLKYVGGVAASISLPIEDVIDALSLLGKAGIRGSTAGTSLRQILVSLSGTSKKASNKLKELGIITKDGTNQFFTAEGKAKSLAEIFQVLQDATDGLTEAERLSAFKIIFNNRALAAANILAKEGAAGFAEMHAEVGKTTAMDVAAERLDNLSGDVEILKGNLETLAIEAGSPFQEFLRGIVQGITELVQKFADLDSGTQQTILKIIAFAAAGFLIMGALSTVLGMILRFVQFFQLLGPAIRLVIWLVAALGKGFIALGTAILTTPIGWIILAIVALIAVFVLLWKKNEGFRNAMKKAWEAIKTAVSATIDWFKGLPAFFSNLWNTITSGVSSAWNAVINFFTVTIPTVFSNAWTTISTGVVNFVTSVITWFQQLPGRIWGFLSTLPGMIGSALAALPGLIGYVLGLAIGTLVRWGIDMAAKAITFAVQTKNNIVNFLKALPQILRLLFLKAKTWAVQQLTNLAVNAYQKALAIRDGIVKFIRELPGKIANFFTNMKNKAVSLLINMVSQARSKGSAILQGIVSFVQQLPGRISNFFSQMKSKALSILVNWVNDGRNKAREIFNAIKNGITNLPSAVSGIFNRVLDAFKGVVRSAFNAAKDFAKGLWDGFRAGLGIHSPSYIEHAMWAITDVLDDETKRMRKQVGIIQNLGNNIEPPVIPAPTMERDKLISNYLAPTIDSLSNEFLRLRELQGSMGSVARDMTASARARESLTLLRGAQRDSSSATDRVDAITDLLSQQPLIGEQHVYNPVAEPASQTAARQASRSAQLGGVR